MMSPQAALCGNGPVSRPAAASMRNNTAKTRTMVSATTTGIGMLSIASRAAGHAVASVAAIRGAATKNPTTGIGLDIESHPAPAAAAARPIQTPNTAANVTLAARGTSMKVISVLTTNTIKVAVMTMPVKSSMLFPSRLSARLCDGGALVRWVKRVSLAQTGLEQPGRQQPAQPAQKNCPADRPPHAVGSFDGSQHFLGDELRLRRRVGVVPDHGRGPLALRRIGLDPTLRLRCARVEVGPDIVGFDQDHADAERTHFVVERFREPFDRVLGARIDAHERRRYEAHDRADVDDQACALTPHAWEHGSDHTQDADDVGVEQRLRLADARFLDGTDQIDTRIVDQDVDPANAASHPINAGVDRSVIADIERHELDACDRAC